MSTPGETGIGFESTSLVILHQIARGFEDLSDRLQHAIEILPQGDPEIAALERVRDKAFHAGVSVRETIDLQET